MSSTTASRRHKASRSVPILARDERVDHFRIVRLIKRGGMGEVYLARDMRLGRRVALKLLRSEKLSSPTAREHLLAEARATARFNHPHIVTIFHVGEHRKMPYLALEYIEGDTLRDRLVDEEALGVSEVVRIGVAIARAVQEAHKHGIHHRDLKPENVVLPGDGRLRVLDFGLAVQDQLKPPDSDIERGESGDDADSEEQTGVVWGSPQYMAPELWRREPGRGPADVWALGIMLFELASATRPYAKLRSSELWEEVCSPHPVPALPNRATLPRDLSRLIEGCLAKEPEKRLVIDEVVERLEELLHGGRRASSGEESPFMGLRAFDEDHADVFFGRDAELAEFLERLRHEPVLPVIGPSGAGKSSFVLAGVIPRLREQGFWKTITLRPGSNPFQALATQLVEVERELDPSDLPTETVRFRQTSQPTLPSQNPEPPEEEPEDEHALDAAELADELCKTPGRLALRLNDLARWGKYRVLLFVDQLEELYTHVGNEETRERFMSALATAADDAREPVRVVFTLRDDFLGRVAQGPETRQVLSRVMLIRSPAPDALREILVRPLRQVGYRWEDGELVERMVEDVRGELTSLPLLQFATQTLWERRDRERRILRRKSYERMGGVAGALAEHADAVLQELSPAQSRVARQLFLRLVTAEGTRQVMQRARLVEDLEGAEEVLARLVGARLLSLRRSDLAEAPEEAEVELVHESLIVAWGRLARWITEGREELIFLSEIGQAAQLWDRRGRLVDEVWQGEALREARRRLDLVTVPYSPLVRDFVEASSDREVRVQRNRLTRRRLVTAALVLVALAAVVVAWQFSRKSKVVRRQEQVAQHQRRLAIQEQRRAEQRHAEAQREGARAALARGALLEARAKLRVSLETLDSPLARALWWQLKRHPLVWQKTLGSTVYAVRFSPDGQTLAAGCQDGSVYLIDVHTLEVRFLRGHLDQIFALEFAPNGKFLATGSWNGEVRLWDLKRSTSVSWRAHRSLVWGLTFTPDSAELITGAYDGNVRVWKVSSAHPKRLEIKIGRRVWDVTVSPDGRTLVSAHRDGMLLAWNVQTGKRVWGRKANEAGLSSVKYSPDGRTLAIGAKDGTLRLLDAKTGVERRALRGHRADVAQVVYSRDGKRLASAGQDRTIRVWDAVTGRLERVLRGHTGEVRGIAFSPDGKTLASGSYDKSVRLWHLAAPLARNVNRGHTALTYGVAFHPSKPLVASGAFDGTVRVWDVTSGRQQHVIKSPSPIMGIDYAPDGGFIATGCSDGTVRIWGEDGVEKRVLRGHKSRVLEVKFSPDGKWLVSGSYDRIVRLWDAVTGALRATLKGQSGAIHGVAFDRQSKRIASGSRDGTVWIWDVATLQVRQILRGHGDDAYGVVFGAEEDTLFVTSSEGDLRRWNLKTRKSKVLSKIKARAYFLDVFGGDGAGLQVGVPSSDQTARLWSPPWKKPILLRGHRGEVNVLRFGKQGKVVATTSDDATLRLWDTATGRPFWRAPVMMGSNVELLTHRGWQSLLVNPKRGLTPTASPVASKWRSAVEQRARLATEDGGSGLVCIFTHDGHVELWDLRRDRQLLRRAVAGLREVLALPTGCVTLSRGHDFKAGGVALLHPRSGAAKTLSRQATAVGWSRGQILVATARKVLLFDSTGAESAEYRAPMGVRALALVHGWLVLGNRDGNIELVPTKRGAARPRFTFEDVPSSPVAGLLAGPMSTLVVGYANGLLGIWNLANGSRLYAARLHGPVRHLRRVGGHLYAATELGDHLVVDLRVFDRSYCDLLREVWEQIPVVWEGGLPVLRPRPLVHVCKP